MAYHECSPKNKASPTPHPPDLQHFDQIWFIQYIFILFFILQYFFFFSKKKKDVFLQIKKSCNVIYKIGKFELSFFFTKFCQNLHSTWMNPPLYIYIYIYTHYWWCMNLPCQYVLCHYDGWPVKTYVIESTQQIRAPVWGLPRTLRYLS